MPQEKMNETLMRKYSARNKVVGNSVGKIVSSVPYRLGSMAMCIGRAIPKWCLEKTPEPIRFNETMGWNWARRSD